MTRYTEFDTIFSSTKVGFLCNVSVHTKWNLFKQSAEYAENQALSGDVNAILRSGIILENIGRFLGGFFLIFFLLSINLGYRDNVHEF